jgi:hypothetical protein
MSELLKANYKIKKSIYSSYEGEEESLENRFDKEALKKLDGSIAFV